MRATQSPCRPSSAESIRAAVLPQSQVARRATSLKRGNRLRSPLKQAWPTCRAPTRRHCMLGREPRARAARRRPGADPAPETLTRNPRPAFQPAAAKMRPLDAAVCTCAAASAISLKGQKPLAISAFSGDSSISEHRSMSSEPSALGLPRRSALACSLVSARSVTRFGSNRRRSGPRGPRHRALLLASPRPPRSVQVAAQLASNLPAVGCDGTGLRRDSDGSVGRIDVPSRCHAAVCMAQARGDANCRPWTKPGRDGDPAARLKSGSAADHAHAFGRRRTRSESRRGSRVLAQLVEGDRRPVAERSTTVVSRTDALARSTRSLEPFVLRLALRQEIERDDRIVATGRSHAELLVQLALTQQELDASRREIARSERQFLDLRAAGS